MDFKGGRRLGGRRAVSGGGGVVNWELLATCPGPCFFNSWPPSLAGLPAWQASGSGGEGRECGVLLSATTIGPILSSHSASLGGEHYPKARLFAERDLDKKTKPGLRPLRSREALALSSTLKGHLEPQESG